MNNKFFNNSSKQYWYKNSDDSCYIYTKSTGVLAMQFDKTVFTVQEEKGLSDREVFHLFNCKYNPVDPCEPMEYEDYIFSQKLKEEGKLEPWVPEFPNLINFYFLL